MNNDIKKQQEEHFRVSKQLAADLAFIAQHKGKTLNQVCEEAFKKSVKEKKLIAIGPLDC